MESTTVDGGRRGRRPDHIASLCDEGLRQLRLGDPASAAESLSHLIRVLLPAAAGSAQGWEEALRQAARGLSLCLEALEDGDLRQRALEALFEAFQAAAERGDCGLRQELPFLMLSHARAEERLRLVAWTRRELAAASPQAAKDCWRLLLELEVGDASSGRALLEQCRAAGHADVVAEKLLDLDRVGEALIVARRELGDPEQLLRFASSPGARAQAPAVMALIEERLARSFDSRLASWLAERYAERGDLARAARLRQRLERLERSMRRERPQSGGLLGLVRRALGR
ncbi:MAG: oxysterol-binding protein [Anaerolineae bacterium]|nr:oxysterol-binding protein [Anaerolineae bacterium]